jgi:hypothetical protein
MSDLIYLAGMVHVPDFLMDIVIIMYHYFVLYDSLERMVLAQQVRLGFSSFKSSWRSMQILLLNYSLKLSSEPAVEFSLTGKSWDGTIKVLNPKLSILYFFGCCWDISKMNQLTFENVYYRYKGKKEDALKVFRLL